MFCVLNVSHFHLTLLYLANSCAFGQQRGDEDCCEGVSLAPSVATVPTIPNQETPAPTPRETRESIELDTPAPTPVSDEDDDSDFSLSSQGHTVWISKSVFLMAVVLAIAL